MDELAESNDRLAGAAPDGAGRPADTNISIMPFPDGVTIEVPPAGLWRGSHGLFTVALIMLGITVPLTVCIGLAVVSGQPDAKGNTAPLWIMPLVFALMWAVEIGMLLAAINMGRRRAALAVTGGSLMILQTGLFGSKQRDWPPGEVEDIRTGPSGLTVNNKPVLELQIIDGGGEKFSLLAGRTDAELEWMAAALRLALGVRGSV